MLTTILSWIVKAISSIVKITYLAQFKGQGIAITKELAIICLTIVPAVVATIVAIRVCKELYKK